MRVLLFGAVGPYPRAFSRALAGKVQLLACLVRRPVDGLLEHWLRHRLMKHDVQGFACDVYSIGAYEEAKVYNKLLKLRADLVIVCGFPRKLPAEWVNALGRYGAVNMHPSLLPRDRGPVPTFWALKRGDTTTGVTMHALSSELDAGDVLGRATMPVPFGGDGDRLLEKLGTLAGELVVASLPALGGAWHLTPQGPDVGPWARYPKHADFEIVANEWTCRNLFHFVRGARAFGHPWAKLADEVYYFAEAISFDEGRQMPGEFMVIGPNLMLKVRDGTVSLRIHQEG